MSQEIVKFDVNNEISLEKDVKEEFQDEYSDNKVCISETAVNMSNIELNESMKNDEISKYQTFSVDHIKTDLLSSQVNDTVSNNIKIEGGISSADIQIQFCNGLPFCNHCHEVYQDYCTKCRVLVHILNKRPNTYTRIREFPEYMLETRESLEHLGIFALKVIPENVRFGPFTGLNSAGLPLKIKRGRFVVSDDKSEYLNWMQYINPARNINEQNLFPFQYVDKLYYCSTRRIQEGEELMVYFGEEYVDNLSKDVELDFVPITKEDVENVFACTFCCLGFRLKEYLAEHKAVCQTEINEIFSIEELVQCPSCKIYLDAKEYLEHHMDYCCETNARHCVLPPAEDNNLQVERCSSVRSKAERRTREMCKRTQSKFRTVNNADFRHHKHLKQNEYKCSECEYQTNYKQNLKIHAKKHLRQKDYKCAKCEYQTDSKSYLEVHIKTKHPKQTYYKCGECEFKTVWKSSLAVHVKTKHLKQNTYKCPKCEYHTNNKSNLKAHTKTKHLQQNDYKCAECEYQTNNKSCLQVHVNTKHLEKCAECEYKTNCRSYLQVHIKTKHPEQNDYECAECEFKTNNKSCLQVHIKTKHLNQENYKCAECEYQTAWKSSLEVHIKTKHVKQNDYKCAECDYKTYRKSYLQIHIKAKHLKVSDYKCTRCEYQTNYKSYLHLHIKTKHLKVSDYKCVECEYQTNYKSCLQVHIKTKHLKVTDYECA